MFSLYRQEGVGLVEVLVAVLLLAVAVLGFSALQINAIKATDESLIRSRAMSISKQISENMRLNSSDTAAFATEFKKLNEGVSNITQYCNKVVEKKKTLAGDRCKKDSCTVSEVAELNTIKAASLGCEKDIMMNMVSCPEMNDINARQCIITSWGSTLPILSEDNQKACGDEDGTYKRGSGCLIMEAY